MKTFLISINYFFCCDVLWKRLQCFKAFARDMSWSKLSLGKFVGRGKLKRY
jgi:hypothetical protein